ncbi:lipopolysaccharide transport periplasmic protein LptA [Acinetobacter larvae]|uniref:Lipopolysaccharide transport periplasmic protein LptA n=2 Tax=Acinetobacter larvae TaxID=1789224 RepID=A0A1B2M474_9GAMM|nr:lipopolysaccharide transport periplasmic protein LptA [Acinetobacter larvae]
MMAMLCSHSYAAKVDPDFQQAIHIQAEYANVNLDQGGGKISGQFIATQGSMQIMAEQVDLRQQPDKSLDHLIATGHPVKFKKTNYQNGEHLNGSAQHIDYNAKTLVLTLTGQAHLSSDQGRDMRAHQIVYALTSGEIEAKTVQIIIPPSKQQHSIPLRP